MKGGLRKRLRTMPTPGMIAAVVRRGRGSRPGEGWPEDLVCLTKEAGLRAGWGGARAWGRAHGEPLTNDGGLESRGPGNDLRVRLEREL